MIKNPRITWNDSSIAYNIIVLERFKLLEEKILRLEEKNKELETKVKELEAKSEINDPVAIVDKN